MERSSAAVLIACALAGCGPESVPFEIEFVLQRDETNQCGSDSCAGIPMACDVAMLVRIADVTDELAYVSECNYIAGGADLCALSSIELPPEPIPNEMSRVQVAVWRERDLQAHDDENGTTFVSERTCPQVTFNLQRQPEANPTPVLGGESYFKVGSNPIASVTIQCLDDEALAAPECQGFQSHFVATAFEFNNAILLPVGQATAVDLEVSAVEPTFSPGTGQWNVEADDVVPLTLGQILPEPRWEAELMRPFERTVCVEVIEPSPVTVATIECVRADDETEVKDGMLVPKDMLDRVEQAIGAIPETGLVLGVVVNAAGQPAPNIQVTPGAGTVQYLSADLTSTTDGLGDPLTATTVSGAFVSTDVPFGNATTITEWTADDLGSDNNEQKPGVGGLVRGKVTFVKIKMKPST